MRNKGLGVGCAVLVSNEIKDMGALASLDISNNNLTQGELKAGKMPFDVDAYKTDMSGVIALSEVLKK